MLGVLVNEAFNFRVSVGLTCYLYSIAVFNTKERTGQSL